MDPVRDLNNWLQGHPRGNLTRYFSWAQHCEGPEHQRTHYATAKFNGREIGFGRGVCIGDAKRDAAPTALQRLKTTPLERFFQ